MNILVLGAGSIGQRHLRNLLLLGQSEVAVYDPSPELRDKASGELGVTAIDSYQKALSWEPEAALICTPNHLHLHQAQELLARNIHLFVEKPLSESWENVSEFLQAVEESGKVVQVGFNMRFHPAVQRIQHALEQGEIGTPWVMRTRFGHYLPQWRPTQDYRLTYSAHADQGGGVLMDCIHEVDYILSWGGEVQGVTSLLKRSSHLEIDTEDYAAVLLEFASGAVGEIRLDYLRYEKLREAEIIGSTGMITWESRGKFPEQVSVRRYDPNLQSYETLFEDLEYDINQTYIDEMKEFLECIEKHRQPQVTAEQASRSLAVVLDAKGSPVPAAITS